MNTIKEIAGYRGCTVQAIYKAKRRAEEVHGPIEGKPDPYDKRITVYADADVQKILEFAPKEDSKQVKEKSEPVSETQDNSLNVSETFNESLVETQIVTRGATILKFPDLKPASIDLQQWDGAPVFQIDDPLQAVDSVNAFLTQVEQAFDADLQQRQQRLIESQQAKEKVNDRVRQFQVKAELYRRDAQSMAVQQNVVTKDLTESMEKLNNLGKSDGQSPASSA